MSRPLVSVVTPAFNRAGFLPETMASVLAQDHDQLELLVLDDGSTDETPALLARARDSRLRVFRHDNMGQARTVNRGVELARGDFVMLLNSDDILLPGAVRRLAAALEGAPSASLAYADFERMDERGTVIGPGVAFAGGYVDAVRLHVCVGGPAVMFRRRAWLDAGGWDPTYRYVPDFDHLLRVGLLGPYVHLVGVLARYRVHGGSITAGRGLAMAREQVRAVETLFARPGLPAELDAVRTEALRTVYVEAALAIDPFPNFPGERFTVLDRLSGAPATSSSYGIAPPATRAPEAVIEWLHREVAARDREIERLHAAVADRDGEVARLRAALAAPSRGGGR